MNDHALEAAILAQFQPGLGRFKRDLFQALQSQCPGWSKTAINRAMTQMRRRGQIVYGAGFWALPNHPQHIESHATLNYYHLSTDD